MKNQKGFIVPLLVAIIAVLVIGGGVYVYSQQNQQVADGVIRTISDSNTSDKGDVKVTDAKSSTSNPSTTQNGAALISDQVILDAENEGRGNESGKFISGKFVSNGKGGYSAKIPGGGSDSFSIEAKGDLNNDGYEDAIVSRFYCGASCGNNLEIVVRDKNGYAHTSDVQFPGYISAGAGQTGLKSVSINNGTISITANNFEGGGEKYETRKYQFLGNKIIQLNVSNVIVQGMSKYTDTNFGYSFWYPSNWEVSEQPVTNSTESGWFQDGSVLKMLSVIDPNNKYNGITIKEFYSPTSSITELGQTKSASPVGVDQKYYFDTNLHLWMYENLTESPEGKRPAGTITPADISNNGMGGLHVFHGASRFDGNSIVPLSAKNFLVISAKDITGYIRQHELANTVVALNPAVATPLSSDLQIKTIQAEKDAYICPNGSTNPPHCNAN